jgi:cytokinesis protein
MLISPSSVNLQELKKGLLELRDGLKRIKPELEEHFADIDQNEMYGRQMWNFVNKAKTRLEDLVDDVNLADTTFTEVIKYYGEDDKNMSSSEFYGIFKTFVTSYKVRVSPALPNTLLNDIIWQKCKNENQTAAEERMAEQKRKRVAEETKVIRQKALDAATIQENEDTSVLDNLLEKLRNGDSVGRRPRRARPSTVENGASVPLTLTIDSSLSGSGDAADVARDMLARLQSDGFETFVPTTPTLSTAQRRRRREKTEDSRSPDVAKDFTEEFPFPSEVDETKTAAP